MNTSGIFVARCEPSSIRLAGFPEGNGIFFREWARAIFAPPTSSSEKSKKWHCFKKPSLASPSILLLVSAGRRDRTGSNYVTPYMKLSSLWNVHTCKRVAKMIARLVTILGFSDTLYSQNSSHISLCTTPQTNIGTRRYQPGQYNVFPQFIFTARPLDFQACGYYLKSPLLVRMGWSRRLTTKDHSLSLPNNRAQGRVVPMT